MPQLHEGHRERLRSRLEKEGFDNAQPHEILEFILYYSIPRRDTNPIAHRLLKRFGSLSAVFEAPRSELIKVEGIGPGSASLLSMIPGLTKRYMIDKNSVGVVLDTSEKLGEFIMPYFIGANNEMIYLICLDKKCKVLNCSLIAEGTFNNVTADIRAICKVALDSGASCVALAHNHSQGFAVPSLEDKIVTQNVVKALKALSIEVIDHIIVARNDYASLALRGDMNVY